MSTVDAAGGHAGLARSLGIANDQDWRGFSFDSAGQLVAASHYNLIDGGLVMLPAYAAAVQQAMRQAGLVK